MAGIQELLNNPESAGVWRVVPEQSTIGFKSKSMWGLVPVKGRFKEFSGDGQITNGQTVFGRIDIKAASLDTRMRKRDEDLRSEKFFDVEKFPDISVVITSAEAIEGDTVDLRTQLTVRDTTAPLPLRAKVAVLDDGAVRLTAQATIDRNDFGVEGNLMGMVVDKVTISGDVVLRRAAG
jgi:polyisoprenoid-binding protein YceI